MYLILEDCMLCLTLLNGKQLISVNILATLVRGVKLFPVGTNRKLKHWVLCAIHVLNLCGECILEISLFLAFHIENMCHIQVFISQMSIVF